MSAFIDWFPVEPQDNDLVPRRVIYDAVQRWNDRVVCSAQSGSTAGGGSSARPKRQVKHGFSKAAREYRAAQEAEAAATRLARAAEKRRLARRKSTSPKEREAARKEAARLSSVARYTKKGKEAAHIEKYILYRLEPGLRSIGARRELQKLQKTPDQIVTEFRNMPREQQEKYIADAEKYHQQWIENHRKKLGRETDIFLYYH